MSKRILLIDDELNTRELYADVLRGDGYEVVTAENGQIALTDAMKGGFDLILLDIIMPKKDGVTFLKEYKTLTPQSKNGPIVMLTVLGDDPIMKTCLESGAVGFLIKSELTPDQVSKEVKAYLTTTTSP